MIKAITVDVGNTLLHPHPSVGAIYARAGARHGIRISAEEAGRRFVAAWQSCQARRSGLVYGRTHEEARAFWLEVVAAVLDPGGVISTQVTSVLHELYAEFARPDCWRLQSGWQELCAACGERGVKLGLMSNWDVRLRGLLNAMGLLEHVDAVVISAECGVEKPAPGIFRLMLCELGIPAAEAVHVGDSWHEDVQAAKRVGMHAVWFNPAAQPRPEPAPDVAEVRDLIQLTELYCA